MVTPVRSERTCTCSSWARLASSQHWLDAANALPLCMPPPGVLDTITFLFFSFSSPECGATLWYRYLMPYLIAFSVAVVAK